MDNVEILNLLIFDHDTWNTVKKVFLAYKGIKMNIFSHIWVSWGQDADIYNDETGPGRGP